MLRDINEYVKQRLYDWADWYSRGNLHGLGYPDRTIEYRLMKEGGVLIKGTGHKSPPTNESAEEIERLVNEMARQNEAMALALRYQYFNHGNLNKKAETLGISRTRFKNYLEMAHQWMAGRLSVRNYR